MDEWKIFGCNIAMLERDNSTQPLTWESRVENTRLGAC